MWKWIYLEGNTKLILSDRISIFTFSLILLKYPIPYTFYLLNGMSDRYNY